MHRPGVACSVTGVGEVVIRAGLARACAAVLQENRGSALSCSGACQEVITQKVVEGQPAGLPCPHRDCGVLAVTVSIVDAPPGSWDEGTPPASSSKDQQAGSSREAGRQGEEAGGQSPAEGCSERRRQFVDVELGVVHNSGSMAFGYLAHDMAAPHCCILRQRQLPGAAEKPGTRMCCEGMHKRWRLPCLV